MIRLGLLWLSLASVFAAPAAAQEKAWPVPQAAREALTRTDFKLAEQITEREIGRCETRGGTPLELATRCYHLYWHMRTIAWDRGDYDLAEKWTDRLKPRFDENARLVSRRAARSDLPALDRARAIELEGGMLEPVMSPGSSEAAWEAARAKAMARYRDAEAIYRAEIARAGATGDVASFELYSALGANLGMKQRRNEEAIVVMQEGLRIWGNRLPRTDRRLPIAYWSVAVLLERFNRYAEAEPHYRKVVELRAYGAPTDLQYALDDLAHNLWMQRRFSASIAVSSDALKLKREIHGEISLAVIRSTADLGVSYGIVGNIRKSEALLREARRIEAQWQRLPVTSDGERYKALGFSRRLFNDYLKAAWLLSRAESGVRGERWPLPKWAPQPD